MSAPNPQVAPIKVEPQEVRLFLGLTRKQRVRIYIWCALALVVVFFLWAWFYLQPRRWYTYTDEVAFQKVARDVKLGRVVWEPAATEGGKA